MEEPRFGVNQENAMVLCDKWAKKDIGYGHANPLGCTIFTLMFSHPSPYIHINKSSNLHFPRAKTTKPRLPSILE
jgi:hypothetical protein